LERIRKLKLERLDVRRLRVDIFFVYKMLFGRVHWKCRTGIRRTK